MRRGRKPLEGVEKLSAGIMLWVTPGMKAQLEEEADEAGYDTLTGYMGRDQGEPLGAEARFLPYAGAALPCNDETERRIRYHPSVWALSGHGRGCPAPAL